MNLAPYESALRIFFVAGATAFGLFAVIGSLLNWWSN